jgi:hypothetical protein
MDYADARGDPYTAAQVVTNTYSIMFSMGLFPEACREWCWQPAAYKTWANFKTNSAKAHLDLRLAQRTTQERGYHGANNTMDSFVTKTADAFANLATATASNCQMLADLTASNKEVTKQIAAKDIKIASFCSSWRGSNGNANRSNDRSDNHTQNNNGRRYNNTNYCWSHG